MRVSFSLLSEVGLLASGPSDERALPHRDGASLEAGAMLFGDLLIGALDMPADKLQTIRRRCEKLEVIRDENDKRHY